VRVRLDLRWLALPLLASAVVFIKEGMEFDALPIGFALWGVFVALVLASGSVIVGLCCVVAHLRRRALTRPSTSIAAGALMVSLAVLFPVPATWDTVEGADSAHWYTEECCD
jgi:hypothetical protein